MPTYSKKPDFFETEQGIMIKQILRAMNGNTLYNTGPSYTANTKLYPNNLMPFVDKQMEYLRTHPAINPDQYIANLRLMTRLR
jgi:hypothetical protein